MWILYILISIVVNVIFTLYYKVATKTSKEHGSLTILLQTIAGIAILVLCPFFDFKLPSDPKVYLFLGIAVVFYAISDRLNTTVRSGIEASTFSIIQQLSTVFMIAAGLLFFKEPFVLTKMIGAALIIFSNILIFYKKGSNGVNKYVLLGILSFLLYSIALFVDVNLSEQFNLPFYVSLTLLGPALVLFIGQRPKLKTIKAEFTEGNKKAILIVGFCWGVSIVFQLKAYQVGQVTSVAPLCALVVIANVIAGYIFLKERDNLVKKIVAAVLIVISVVLIQL